ncbi:MAG: beta-ketoacyl-ACP synthase [Silanimonas sp.]
MSHVPHPAAEAPVYLNALGLCCALGKGANAVAGRLFVDAPVSGVQASRAFLERECMVGLVPGDVPSLDDRPLTLQGRNNALLRLALDDLGDALPAALHGVDPTRVAIVLGSSTSGIAETEQAFRHRDAAGALPADFHYAMQEMGTPARFVAHELGLSSAARMVISTACSSSAKALATAARLLRSGRADVVIAGGADSLCSFTLAGFTALEAVSPERCNPFSTHRRGINIGEGAALFIVSRHSGPVRLCGWGESADAHHMSAPDPTGRGAKLAIASALRCAGLASVDIDYVNLHGTATAQNDAMEAPVSAALYAAGTPMSSTKPLTGHALGAAGAIEAALCWLMLARNPERRLLPQLWDGAADAALPRLHFAAPGERAKRPLRHVASHSFAFGGSNAALVLGAA